jgi:hypothetical protein
MSTIVATATLVTRSGLRLGSVEVESITDGRILGEFTPGPDYPQVEHHFLYFEELVDGCVLSLTDQAMAVIDGLEIVVELQAGNYPVHDTQIYSDGGFSCRLPKERNGAHS